MLTFDQGPHWATPEDAPIDRTVLHPFVTKLLAPRLAMLLGR